jgi:hypothetical protein
MNVTGERERDILGIDGTLSLETMVEPDPPRVRAAEAA